MSVKVAIITRTKDRKLFLKRALSSVASQTFEDWVHVIVNDGGDRGQVDVLVNSLGEEQKKRTKVFHRESPSGAPDTLFNESIDRVNSEYFVIHDDDDTWHPDFLTRTVEHLNANKQLGAVVVRSEKITENIEDGLIQAKKTTRYMPHLKAISLYQQCIDNQLTPIATLFRRSAYEKVGKFDDTLPVVGDWEFGLRLLMSYDVDFIDPGFALASYHHRDFVEGSAGNTSFAGNDKHRYYTNLVANRYLREELRDGRLGVGYIMSNIKYNQSYIAQLFKRFLPLSAVEKIKKRIRD